MSACNCCDQFATNVWTFQTRNRLGLGSFCGSFNSDDGKYYRTLVETFEDPWIDLPGWSGSATITRTTVSTYSQENGCEVNVTYNEGVDPDVAPYDDGSTFEYPIGKTWSDEDTLEDVKDRAIDNLGSFGEWDEAVVPPVGQGFVESLLSLNEAEFRIVHAPTATGYLKVWFKKRVYTWVVGEGWTNPTEEDIEPYVWSDSPPDLAFGIDEEENKIYGEAIAVEVNDEEKAEIYPVKFSLMEGYEPSNPTDIEPFLNTVRPNPDCESNGVPTLDADCPFR